MGERVKAKFDSYPAHIKPLMLNLRSLVLGVAETHSLGTVEEALKWGEPSYQVKGGSPVRMNWSAKDPEHYFLYFNCNTRLVDTFREVYGHALSLQGNRAIVLNVADPLPEPIVCHCVELAFNYKRLSHLPLLGV
ncbi:DUF1801 domain-containing protein [Photobacterium halotolerans]|uniref:YdhG-like domain-containing protein n=1 Tax=Photobacterium halotolerans TaxID=265726 RepID=A0A0F5VCA5_9GAMM|nr:DUF1801 domain-containing protein [Photobacterium halotolerans]KKC99805.1 hypothetical protein KY46_11375 [Photobacterium halotolerans]